MTYLFSNKIEAFVGECLKGDDEVVCFGRLVLELWIKFERGLAPTKKLIHGPDFYVTNPGEKETHH